MEKIRSGVMPTMTDAELDHYLAAPAPLVFWRQKRALAQAALAAAGGISQPHLAMLEAGKMIASAEIHARLTKLLNVRIADITEDR
jgi:transcriptional regulator with XRE-family HTH domain